MKLKIFLLFTGCIVGCSILVSLLLNQTMSMLAIVDNGFLVSLTFVIIGATLFVLQGGLFNGVAYSFKRFFSRVSKNGVYAYELDGDMGFVESPTYSITYPMLFTSLFCNIISILLSLILM